MNEPETFCNYYNKNICRSCALLEVPYSEQILIKEKKVRESLSFIADLNLCPSVVSDQTSFRNKAKMIVSGTSLNPTIGILGDIKSGVAHELLDCPIHHPKLNELISALPSWIQNANLIPYQIAERTGELKSVILFYSEISNEFYLRFVLRSKECISRIRKILPKMQEKFPALVCVSANLQPIPHAILEGPEEIILSNRLFIHHQIANLTLNLSPQAFVQTHSKLASALYQTSAEWIRNLSVKTMLELYCGQGAFSFFAAPFIQKGVGLEINQDAVKSANQTATRLGFSHLSFVSADVTEKAESSKKVQELAKKIEADLILVNPPRRGLGKPGVDLILSERPEHLIYSSCSIDSLSEDLKSLHESYRVIKMQIFDLFPHTAHFEILNHLQRR